MLDFLGPRKAIIDVNRINLAVKKFLAASMLSTGSFGPLPESTHTGMYRNCDDQASSFKHKH